MTLVKILVVEDNEGDQGVLKEAFKQCGGSAELIFAVDADQAMSVLKASPSLSSEIVILLDLNLPKKSGKEFLQELKADAALKHIPVLILTSSHAEKDIQDCYHLGANCYLKKPMRFRDFLEMVQSILAFWFQYVLYPDPLP